jgi:peptide-methionine (R)-S-oxide reductase
MKLKAVLLAFMTIFLINCKNNENKLTIINVYEGKEKSKVGETNLYEINKTDEQWRSELTDEQYWVLRQKGTERAFTGLLLDNKDKGMYCCAGCGNELFESSSKFHSGCGWPSFFESWNKDNIEYKLDSSHGMIRTEIICSKCGGHLGHVFDDGPEPTGKRYCVNSVSLIFKPATADSAK